MFKKILILIFIIYSGLSFSAKAENQIDQLKKISAISSKNEPAVFGVLFKSSQQLSKKWDKNLAQEIARVFAFVIKYNQNSYVIELIDPATKKWKDKFEKIIISKLGSVERKLYKENKKLNRKESLEGNG